jgi:glycosyltransferase involved in cell wall biosynthesis
VRILHVVPTYLPATRYGGPIHSVHGLARAQAALGHAVSVATTSVDGPTDSPVEHAQAVALDGVDVHYFRSRRLRRLYYAPAMRAFFRRELKRFDVVHLHSVFLWPTNVAARECVRAQVPYVLAPRGMLVQRLINARSGLLKRAWLGLIERYTLKHAALFHATSTDEIKEAEALGVTVRNPQVLGNGVWLDAPLETTAEAASKLVFLGRLSWKKRIDWLIDALPDGVTLQIIGNDDEGLTPALTERAHAAGMGDRVRFSGALHGEAKLAALATARALVLPSIQENFGNVVLEAWAQRTPVVVSRGVGLASDVERCGGGWVFDDRNGLSTALAQCCASADEARRRGVLGHRHAQREFSWPAIAERSIALYRTLTPCA